MKLKKPITAAVWIAALAGASLTLALAGRGDASGGDSRAQREAARALQAEDYAAAADHLKPAARAGEPEALYLLAELHLSGRGVKADPRRAFRLYRAAERQGHGPASAALGEMYRDGVGVEPDAVQAYAHFVRAGAAASRRAVGDLAAALTAEQRARAENQAADLDAAGL